MDDTEQRLRQALDEFKACAVGPGNMATSSEREAFIQRRTGASLRLLLAASDAAEQLLTSLDTARADVERLRVKADLWDAINAMWSFPGRTLEDVVKARAAELLAAREAARV